MAHTKMTLSFVVVLSISFLLLSLISVGAELQLLQAQSFTNNSQLPTSTNALKPYTFPEYGYQISIPSNWQATQSPLDSPGGVCFNKDYKSFACIWTFQTQGYSLEDLIKYKDNIKVSSGWQAMESKSVNFAGTVGRLDTYRLANNDSGLGDNLEMASYIAQDKSGEVYELMLTGQGIEKSPVVQNIVTSFKITDQNSNAVSPTVTQNPNLPQPSSQLSELDMLKWKMTFQNQRDFFDLQRDAINSWSPNFDHHH